MDHKPLTLIIPSRGRLESLKRCVNSAIAYADQRPKICIFFDDCSEYYDAYNPPPQVFRYDMQPRAYYVKLINMAFHALSKGTMDHFIICNNDQEFIESGWDIIAMDKLYEKWPDGMGVVEIGNGETLSYNCFISRVEFWNKHYNGKLFDPRFKQYYADAERLACLNANEQFARIYPGLVNTHSCWDEVKHSGRQWMARDKEVYEDIDNAQLAEKCL